MQKEKKKVITGNCFYCKKEIILKRRWQKYCNAICRWKDWDKKHPRIKEDATSSFE